MTAPGAYESVLAPAARRALSGLLPEAVASAAIDLTTALVQQPKLVGEALRGELAGVWSARRGTYRVLYEIREARSEVLVLRAEHRPDVYRRP